MSIDGRNDNSQLVRANNSLWDDSNRGFLQRGIFLFSRLVVVVLLLLLGIYSFH